MSLLVIGIEMAGISLSDIHWDRDVVGALIGSLSCLSGLCAGSLALHSRNAHVGPGLYHAASMPAMTQMTVVAKSIGADVRYSTQVTFITVVMGIVVIPLYMFIVG